MLRVVTLIKVSNILFITYLGSINLFEGSHPAEEYYYYRREMAR